MRAPTTSGGTDYGIGTAGNVLKTGANGIYWAADSQGVTSVQVSATSPVQSSTATAQTSTLSTTISLADGYGDTKNPYASKTKNYVLAAGATANSVPSFRALVAADLPTISGLTTGSYGPSANVSGTNGATMSVPYITVDAYGRITAISNKTYTAVNTWRGIQDNLTSNSNTTESLSAKQGYLLANGSARDSTKLALDGSNNMTANVNIITGDTDKFVNFWYNTNKTAGASWRIGMLGSGSNDTNYFTIDSGTSTTSATTWNTALRIGQNTYDIGISGNLYPISNDNKTLGTSSLKWSNIYATTFTGNLTGNVTGTLSTTRITLPGITGTGTTGADQGSSDTSTRYKPAVWTFNAGIAPVDGDIITIKQPCAGHDYGTWLTLDNGTTYHPVVYNASDRITTHFTNGTSVTLCYDANGTASVFAVGGAMSRVTATGVWRVWNTYNTNNDTTGYYHRRIYPNLKAGGAIHPYTIIMQLPNGKWSSVTTTAPTNPVSGTISPVATGKAASTSGYIPDRVLLMYARATYADGNNIGTYNIWSAYTGLIDARYSFNLTSSAGFTAYTPVYLVGALNSSGLFVLDSTQWWTQTLPTSDDGKIYIYIGDAYDWYRLTFTEDKPIYWFKDGKLQLFSGASTYATSAAKDSAGNVIKDTYLKLSGGTLTGNLIFNRVSNTPMIRFNNAKGGSERNASITINDTNNNLQFWQYGPNNTSNSNANNAECYRLPTPDDNTESAIYDIFTTKNFSCNFKHISTFSASSNSNKKIYGNHVLVFYYYGNSCYGIVSFWNTGSNQYLQTYLQTGSYVTVTSGYVTNNTTNENNYYIQIANTASSGTVRGYYFSDVINS